MSILSLESSGSSALVVSMCFTSILPSPATGENEEIQIKDLEQVDWNGVDVGRLGHDNVKHGNGSSTVLVLSTNEGITM